MQCFIIDSLRFRFIQLAGIGDRNSDILQLQQRRLIEGRGTAQIAVVAHDNTPTMSTRQAIIRKNRVSNLD
jgi:hypothetical protein